MDQTQTVEVTRILAESCEDSTDDIERLLPLLYGEMRKLAMFHLQNERAGHTLQATAVVNEAYLRLATLENIRWKSRSHFLAVASTMMRRVLVDHARGKRAQKRGGGEIPLSIEAAEDLAIARDVDLLALDEALTALSQLDDRQSRIVELRFFGGLTIDEIAEAVGLAPRTVKSEWQTAKAWLYDRLRNG